VEDLGLDERITLKWIFKKRDGGGGVDYIDMAMAEDRDSWAALVNAVMNLPISLNCLPS
jgi:hypothetical protein